MKKNRTNLISIYLSFSFALFLLLSLGVWQLNKHKLKSYNQNLLIKKLNEETKELDSISTKIDNLEIVKIKGVMLEENSLFFEPRTYKGKIGYHKLVPLRVGGKNILVNRGFTKEKKRKKSEKKNRRSKWFNN